MGTKHHRLASSGTDGTVRLHLLGKQGATYAEVGGQWAHERSLDLDVTSADQKVRAEGSYFVVENLPYNTECARPLVYEVLDSEGSSPKGHIWGGGKKGGNCYTSPSSDSRKVIIARC